MRVLIIEDEHPASQKLIRLLHEVDDKIEVVKVLESVEAATNWLFSNQHPELIFMDIQLEDGICFEIFENIELKTPVIFTTAYDEYSLKAFKVNSVDYLLKPITIEQLKGAVDKFRFVHQRGIDLIKIESMIKQMQPKLKERFLIKIGDHFRSIQVSSINCFFIKERCNFILVDKGKNYAIDYSLDKVEKMLDPKIFFRVNREFVINFNAIRDIVAYSSSRLRITIDGWTENEEIFISRERVADFKKWMDR
jgi:DNA-binding LytR/AlgR family response regulator